MSIIPQQMTAIHLRAALSIRHVLTLQIQPFQMQICLRFPAATEFLPELQVYITSLNEEEEETSLKTDHEYADLSSPKPAQGAGIQLGELLLPRDRRRELLFSTNFQMDFKKKTGDAMLSWDCEDVAINRNVIPRQLSASAGLLLLAASRSSLSLQGCTHTSSKSSRVPGEVSSPVDPEVCLITPLLETGAGSWEAGAGNQELGSRSWELRAGGWEAGAGKQELGSRSWEPGAGGWEAGAGKQELGSRSWGLGPRSWEPSAGGAQLTTA